MRKPSAIHYADVEKRTDNVLRTAALSLRDACWSIASTQRAIEDSLAVLERSKAVLRR